MVERNKTLLKKPFINKNSKYKLGNYGFDTKKQIHNFISSWLKISYIDYELNDDDKELFLDLFRQHPRATEKLANLKTIFLEYHASYFHFSLKYNDDTVDDISYTKCLYGETEYGNIMKAFRDTIREQIFEYRQNIFRDNVELICPETNIILRNNSDTHIDHNFRELTFKDIVTNFCLEKNYNILDISTENIRYRQIIVSDIIRQEFENYHRDNAKLRAVHKSVNMSTSLQNNKLFFIT